MCGGEGVQSAEMVREAAISHWLSAFSTPGIIAADKDIRFIGKAPRGFCTSRNIAPHAVIPGSRQSLGSTERRRGHFRMAIDHIIGNR